MILEVTHEAILLTIVRKDLEIVNLGIEATKAGAREAALVYELDAARTSMRDMDAEIARLREQLDAKADAAPLAEDFPLPVDDFLSRNMRNGTPESLTLTSAGG